MASARTHLWETVLAGKWSNLGDATLQDALEAAYSSGSDGYQFKARGYTYDIDFGRMKQINVTTKRERNLRRVRDPRASVATAAAAPTFGAVHLPSTKLYHGPTAGRLYTGPSTAAMTGSVPPPRATRAAPSPPSALASSAPKTTASGPKTTASGPKTTTSGLKTTAPAPKTAAPTTAKSSPPVASAPAWTKSAKAPVATAWSRAKAIPAPVAPVPVVPPVAPTPPPPVKVPLPHQGRVKTFFKEKGYGFILLDDDQEVFFHVSCVSELIDGCIRANDTVEVSVTKSGKPRALQVRVKRRGSIFKQMCTNKCCRDKGDRHFEDRCPLKRKHQGCDRDDTSVSTACS